MLEMLTYRGWLRINVLLYLDVLVQTRSIIILPVTANFHHKQKYTTSLMEIVQSLKIQQELWDLQYLCLFDE